MDRSVRSRTSSTSSLRSVPSTPVPTPAGQNTPAPSRQLQGQRVPSPDRLAASLTRLRAERALSNPATPSPTPNPSAPHQQHTLHPDQIMAGLSGLGGDEGIASGSVPGTPAPTPFSPSPSVHQHIKPDQLAASIARLRDEGVLSLANTQPTTPSTTPAYPPYQGQAQVHNLGIIPEHLAEGIACLDAGRDEGLDSGSNPCTPIPTPYSPSPAQHSVLAEQLAAGITRLKVEEGMSSGGSSGMPATPAPTPFSHGPGGVRPEDLAAGISRLSVIQEAADSGPQVAINVLEASDTSAVNASSLSNYFGSPQSSGDSIFDQLTTPALNKVRSRSNSNSGSGFQDVSMSTPAKRHHSQGGSIPSTPQGLSRATTPQMLPGNHVLNSFSQMSTPQCPTTHQSSTPYGTPASQSYGTPASQSSGTPASQSYSSSTSLAALTSQVQPPFAGGPPIVPQPQHFLPGGVQPTAPPPQQLLPGPPPQQLLPGPPPQQHLPGPLPQQLLPGPSPQQLLPGGVQPTPPLHGTMTPTTPGDLLSPASTISAYATPTALTPVVEPYRPFPPAAAEVSMSKPPQTNLQVALPTVNRPQSPARQTSNMYSDAWIPRPPAKEVLDNLASTPGTFYPSRDQLTCPGVTPGSEQGDPVRDLVAKYQGEGEACKRRTLAADGVTTDTRGLQQLISSGNYRAAINLTAHLLEMYGQGKGKAGQLSKHSQTSFQIWFSRLALLVNLKLFTVAEAEAEQFGELDKPDVFMQYYPELYGGRRGSLAPWSMRLLLAQLPGLCGKHIDSFNRLFALHFSLKDMLRNLSKGLAPDGQVWLEATPEELDSAVSCWKDRERQVLSALVNNAVAANDIQSAIKCLDMLVLVESDDRKAALYAAYGRLYLQLGNIGRADTWFAAASKLRDPNNPEDQLDGLMDSAFLAIGQGQFESALERFQTALSLSVNTIQPPTAPANPPATVNPGMWTGNSTSGGVSKQEKVIRNNISVCLLYLGRLEEGLKIVENSITSDTANIQGNPILNLCTLYELESSYALQKKIGMLGLISIHCSDSFPISSLKL